MTVVAVDDAGVDDEAGCCSGQSLFSLLCILLFLTSVPFSSWLARVIEVGRELYGPKQE